MSDQSRLKDQNRIRSAGKVRRLTLEDLGISLIEGEEDVGKRLANKAADAADHVRGEGALRGAAVASAGGAIYAAPRIETESLQQTTHALHTAVMKALSEGVNQIVAASVYASEGEVRVCGFCRQLLLEYGSEGIVVRGFVEEKQAFERPIGDLLPDER